MSEPNQFLPQIAVVGCGYWGRNIVRNFAEFGVLAALCDTELATAATLATAYDVPAEPLDGLLANPTIDAIAIASPAAAHANIAQNAFQAGKHVFVEKPMALDVEGAARLVETADNRDRILMVGHLLQYHPAFITLKNLLSEGRLGQLRYIYSNRLNLGRVRREENILWSFAPHDITMILALVGEEPNRETTIGHCYLQESAADTTTTHLSFPSGPDAHIYVSWLHPFKEQKLVAIGDDSTAVFDDTLPWDKKLVVYPHHVDLMTDIPTAVQAEAEPVALTEEEPLAAECRHFVECIQNGTHPRTDGAEQQLRSQIL